MGTPESVLATASRGLDGGLAWALFGMTMLLALAPALSVRHPRVRRWGRPSWFALAVLAAFLALRWTTWFAGPQPNPDEAHMLAGALTLREHPVFWRDVDGTTHGPLTHYALLGAPALGLSLDYAGARVIGTLLAAGTLLAVWLGARVWLDETAVRLAMLPALGFWGGASFWDFFQYSSELAPVFLIAAGGATGLVALRLGAAGWRRAILAGAGAILGLVPYAKLQGVPLAAAVGGALLAGAVRLRTSAGPGRGRWAEAGWLLGGALAPTLLLVAALAAGGMLGEFNQVYLRNNLLYANSRPMSWAEQWRTWGVFLDFAPEGAAFYRGTLWAAMLLLVPATWRGGHAAGWAALGWTLALAALFTVLAPGRAYHHYLHFLVAPGVFLLACGLHAARQNFETVAPGLGRVVLLLGTLVAVWPLAAFCARETRASAGPAPALSMPAACLRAEARSGDRLTIWGYRPSLHVETGLPQGTRDGQTQRMIEPGPMRAYYRARFLADFQRNRPRWFVDTVGPGDFAYRDRCTQGHDTFPELGRVVRADYEPVGEYEGCRLYERTNDPLP